MTTTKDGWRTIITCDDPENCEEMHNEGPVAEQHHYGCECRDCEQFYWLMKH